MNEHSTLGATLPKKKSWRLISIHSRVTMENSGSCAFAMVGSILGYSKYQLKSSYSRSH